MTIRFEVTGETVAEFKQNFGTLLGVFLPLLSQKSAGQPVPAEPTKAEPPAEDKPKSDPKKVAAKATAKKDEPKNDAAPTIEDVRDKLKALGSAISHDAVYEVLTAFEAKKASDVPAEKYADLIAAVDVKLQTKEAA